MFDISHCIALHRMRRIDVIMIASGMHGRAFFLRRCHKWGADSVLFVENLLRRES